MNGLRARLLPAMPDTTVLLAAMMVLAYGLVMVASASLALSEQLTGHGWHFFVRQLMFGALGLTSAYLVFRFLSLRRLAEFSGLLWLFAAVLLLAVLVPGIGHEVNGSLRWLDLGPVKLQVSELAKLSAIVYLAGHLAKHGNAVRNSVSGAVRPMVSLGLLAVLALSEPDLGAAGVLMLTGVLVLFLSGMRLAPLCLLMLTGVLVLGAAVYLEPYRLVRLKSFLDPWADPYGAGFQLTQSLIAVGLGELSGAGLGLGLQKLFYLPEAHTDFILAVLAEELGLAGVAALGGLYAILVARCVAIGRRAERAGAEFAAALCYGVGIWFALQVLINMGVNLGLLPTKGLTLPLVSYGGSSLLCMLFALGLVLRADLETRPAARRASRAPGGNRQLPLVVTERGAGA